MNDTEIVDAIEKAANETQSKVVASSDPSSPTEQELLQSDFHDHVLDLLTKRQR